jgi:hypothetical protein
MASVWAPTQTNAGPPPPDPSVWAQPDPGLDLHAGLARIFPPPPQVTLDPNPEHQIEGHEQNKLQRDYQKDASPWGTPENHPGIGGKIAHVLSKVGQIAGDAIEPGLMANIPGTDRNRQMQEGALARDIYTGEQDEANQAHLGAETAQENETTKEMPGKTESEEGLQNAETGEAQARAKALTNPPDATPEIGTYRSLVKMGMSPSEALQEIEKDKAMALRPQQIPPEQQYLTEYVKTHPGSTVAQAEHQYMLDTQRPPQAPAVNMFVPAPGGGETLQTVRPGQTVAPGAQTAAGVNAVDTPTTQQRTAAGRAQTVIQMAPEVLSRIDSLGPKLGPIEGNWNAFMQGKVGMDDPDFAALRSDLLMMSSAVALAHAQGRLPENLREEFDNAINAPKQTPENLKATINTMIPWLQQMQNQARPNAGEKQPTAQPLGETSKPDGNYTMNGKQYRVEGGKVYAH